MDKPGKHGVEPFFHLFLSGGRKGCKGASVEGVLQGDDFIFSRLTSNLGETPGQFQCGFVGFRPAVTKEDLVHAGVLDQFLRQPGLGFTVVQVRYMSQTLGLFLKRYRDMGIAMTQVGDRNTTDKIQIFLSLRIIEACSTALDQGNGKTPVGVHDIAVRFPNNFFRGQKNSF